MFQIKSYIYKPIISQFSVIITLYTCCCHTVFQLLLKVFVEVRQAGLYLEVFFRVMIKCFG